MFYYILISISDIVSGMQEDTDEHFLAGPSHYPAGTFYSATTMLQITAITAPPCRTPFLWAFLMSQISREIPNLSLASDHCSTALDSWGCLLLGETPWTQIYLIHQQPSQGWRYKLNCLLLWLPINNQPTLRNFTYPVTTKLYWNLSQLQRKVKGYLIGSKLNTISIDVKSIIL